MKKENMYLCIDLKSFYASVECVKRSLDPLKDCLVVADESRTDKTICLAVSAALKTFNIPGRLRLFEVKQMVDKINKERLKRNNNKPFKGSSCNIDELNNDYSLKLDFIIAKPFMSQYIDVSSKIYSIYLKYISSDDIHIYSIDEVFMDISNYLKSYKMDAYHLAMQIIKDVLKETKITATAGIGTNLYLAKVAMDIQAKHSSADKDGVRIAFLDEMTYRKKLWDHKPLSSFWRIGKGIERRLNDLNVYTMGDLALLSIENEDILYKNFGINAELLIDHAWGYESTTMKHIKNYKPINKSLSSGQVLSCPYNFNDALLVSKEMADQLSLDLVSKHLLTSHISLYVSYEANENYDGEFVIDYLNRKLPKPSHGSISLNKYSSSTSIIVKNMELLFKRIVDKKLLIRRINIGCNVFTYEEVEKLKSDYEQLNMFVDYDLKEKNEKKELVKEEKEKKLQETILNIKGKYGKNSIVKAMNVSKKATMIERNKQIGGHNA